MLTILNCFSVSESLPSFLFPCTLLSGKKGIKINSKEAKLLNFRGLSPKESVDRSKLISHLFNRALVRYRAYNEHPYFLLRRLVNH